MRNSSKWLQPLLSIVARTFKHNFINFTLKTDVFSICLSHLLIHYEHFIIELSFQKFHFSYLILFVNVELYAAVAVSLSRDSSF